MAPAVIVVAHDARLHHGVAFPVAPLLLVIILQRREAQHQRAAVTKWPQTHIHPVNETVLGRLIERLDQPLPHTGKELRIIQLAPSATGHAIFRPGKNQVDIGGKVKFAAAKFSHA